MADSDFDRPMGRMSPHFSKSGRSSPVAATSVSLTHIHIADAILKSPDNGATLDFQHKNLSDVGESGAEELATVGREDLVEDESSVLRIALSYNRLRTLPMAFALLSRLRYLNLKNNNFSVFPDVLTVMPSLEILDIGRNKIKRLPSNPGSLERLRVFSIYKNKLTRLPPYIAKFKSLNVLKLSHNPFDWPPKSVLEPIDDIEDSELMVCWIRSLQKWMEDNSSTETVPVETSLSVDRKPSNDSNFSLDSLLSDSLGGEETFMSWTHLPIHDKDFDAGVTPHARSFSIESDISLYSLTSQQEFADSLPQMKSPRPPPLQLGQLPPSVSSSPSISPAYSPVRYLPTPEDSVDEDTTTAAHIRNASYAGGMYSPRSASLLPKKSLPDLRTAKFQFGGHNQERGHAPALPSRRNLDDSMPSPHSPREHSSSSEAPSTSSPQRSRLQGPLVASPTTIERRVPAMDVERNSYFRRLSTLPSSTISKTIPQALLNLIDAVRGILFAVSQVYQSLQHYTVYAIDERLSAVLLKVLDPASTYLGQLIEALDRFDSFSRKGVPPPAVCRGVLESCKDNVAVFGKAVAVLALQLKVLATRDDVRYTRQMLLVLYGAAGEISNSWLLIATHIDVVQPLLREHRPPPSVAKSQQASSSRAEHLDSLQASAPASSSSMMTPPPTRSAQQPNGAPITNGRTRTARRHAGSFSSKDVQIGRSLPSYTEPFSPVAHSPRLNLRHVPPSSSASPVPPVPSSSSSAPPPTSSHPTAWRDGHSRQSSQTSPPSSSASTSSNVLAPKAAALEIPTTNSTTFVDKDAIDAMDLAVKAAPAVWEMMDAILNDVQEPRVDLRELLGRAQAVTERLSENIRAVRDGKSSADRKTLREDAHVFVKTVVQLSNVIKTYGGAHPLSSTLRNNMVKLTNSTQEFVILLHVSSFSPSSTPRPYSPMVNGSTFALVGSSGAGALLGAAMPDEARSLGSGLSRSRSAQPSANPKVAQTPTKEIPRSALPHQTFKLPATPKSGMRSRDESVEGPG